MEKFLGYLVGNASQGQLEFILYACLALVAYLLIFIWYAKQMKKRNIIYAQKLNRTKRRGASAPLLLVDHPDNFFQYFRCVKFIFICNYRCHFF